MKIHVLACNFIIEKDIKLLFLLNAYLDAMSVHHLPDPQARVRIHQHIVKHR